MLLSWQVLWDEDDPTLFVASNSKGQLFTYLLTQQSLSGQQLELLATQSLPVGHKPVLLADGRLSVRLKSGAVDTWVLETHKPLLEHRSDSKQLHRKWVHIMPTFLHAQQCLGRCCAGLILYACQTQLAQFQGKCNTSRSASCLTDLQLIVQKSQSAQYLKSGIISQSVVWLHAADTDWQLL